MHTARDVIAEEPARSRYAGAVIGIDLDNTLICYDQLFRRLARQSGLIPAEFSGDKRAIRDRVRSLADGDAGWQRLQAQAYGSAIAGAALAPGALDFIRAARGNGAEVVIVSHKTEFSPLDPQRVDLRRAALERLGAWGVTADGLIPRERIYFESTRAAKLARIASLGCSHFIDDLPEVLTDAAFPEGVERLLFGRAPGPSPVSLAAFQSFAEIGRTFER